MIAGLLTAVLLHPFHGSIAEAEWNRKSQSFEIAIRLDPRDLTTALSRHSGDQVNLETTPSDQLEQILTKYVDATFIVKDDQKRSVRWRQVGFENEVRYAWLYLELKPKSTVQRLDLRNRMLMEVASSQVNTLILKDAGTLQTLRFTPREPHQKLIRQQDGWRIETP